MAHNSDEIRGVLVQAGDARVLLPNAAVGEVLAKVPVEPIADVPSWLAGRIQWHGWPVPVVSFARLAGLHDEGVTDSSKFVVLKALGGDEMMPYLALLTPSFPRLVSVPRDGLLADASEDTLPEGVLVRILLGEEVAMLPDLDKVEAMVSEALQQAA
ncbi:MAG: chemotaxis protein CheW [Pseudoxanthomonas sp.]